MGAARSGWSMLHQSAFLLALRNASPGTECASRTSLPHFLVDRPFAVVWLYFSWLPRWRDSFRALGGSLFGVPSTDRGSRLRDMSNFCCLPGRAGGTPLLVRGAREVSVRRTTPPSLPSNVRTCTVTGKLMGTHVDGYGSAWS